MMEQGGGGVEAGERAVSNGCPELRPVWTAEVEPAAPQQPAEKRKGQIERTLF